MKYFLLTVTSLISLSSLCQRSGDSKIIVITGDTAGIYQKVKYALVNSNFIVKDNGNVDTLDTYSREYDGMHCMARAIIKADTVIIAGAYGLTRIDDWGYTQSPKNYKRIIYYSGGKGKGWKLLSQIAKKLGGASYYLK